MKDIKELSKMEKCKFYFPDIEKIDKGSVLIKHKCTYEPDNCGDCDEEICEKCLRFKSKYIEYPITVNKINLNKAFNLYNEKVGARVKVKICENEYKDKEFDGILLGEIPVQNQVSYNETDGILTVTPVSNPAIYIEKLKRVVYGFESWWHIVENDKKEKMNNEI